MRDAVFTYEFIRDRPFPHVFQSERVLTHEQEHAFRGWCEENLGISLTYANRGGNLWYVAGGSGAIGFLREADAFLFKLHCL